MFILSYIKCLRLSYHVFSFTPSGLHYEPGETEGVFRKPRRIYAKPILGWRQVRHAFNFLKKYPCICDQAKSVVSRKYQDEETVSFKYRMSKYILFHIVNFLLMNNTKKGSKLALQENVPKYFQL